MIEYVPITLEFAEKEKTIELFFNEITSATYEEYTGSYIAIPKVTEQIFNTHSKLMRDDFTVKEIPYEETHNAHGITAVIAS